MRIPLVYGLRDHGHSRDSEFKEALVDYSLRANGTKEAVPAVCDGRGVQQGEIEGDEGSRAPPGGDAGVDLGCFGVRSRRLRGGVGKAHLGGTGGAEVSKEEERSALDSEQGLEVH